MNSLPKIITYTYNDQEYVVEIYEKRIRNIYFRYKNDKFVVTAPFFTSERKIISLLNEFAPKLLKRNIKKNNILPPIGEDYIFIYGNKFNLIKANETRLIKDTLFYKNEKSLDKYLKDLLFEYISYSYFKYKELMNVKSNYSLSIRKMKTRLGSNSKRSNKLTFALSLVHFDKEIIDSVVIHELAHYFQFNHSYKFYNILYKYCPNYKQARKKLIKGIYK